MEVLFRPADSEKEIAAAIGFMAAAPMHYPRYREWLERSHGQMLAGRKHVLWCRCEDHLAATLTWQTHPREAFTAELKNLRVHPGWRGMDIGRFLLKMFEREAASTAHSLLRCDMGEGNPAFPFLLRQGWQQVELVDLYGTGVKDILMAKTLVLKGHG